MITCYMSANSDDDYGGFYTDIYGSGTNYADSISPILDQMPVDINGNTLTKPGVFRPDMVGNGLHLRQIGVDTITDSWYIITSATYDHVTLDRNTPIANSYGACWVGGRLKSIGGLGYALTRFSENLLDDHHILTRMRNYGGGYTITTSQHNVPNGPLIISQPAKVILYGITNDNSDDDDALISQNTSAGSINAMVASYSLSSLWLRNIKLSAIPNSCGYCVQKVAPTLYSEESYPISCLNVDVSGATIGFEGCTCIACSATGCDYGFNTLTYQSGFQTRRIGYSVLSTAINCNICGFDVPSVQCIARGCDTGFNLQAVPNMSIKNCTIYNCNKGVTVDGCSLIVDVIFEDCMYGVYGTTGRYFAMVRNCFSYNVANNYGNMPDGCITNLSQSPFVDPANGNFKLNEYGLQTVGDIGFGLPDVNENLSVGAVQYDEQASSQLTGSRSRRSIVI